MEREQVWEVHACDEEKGRRLYCKRRDGKKNGEHKEEKTPEDVNAIVREKMHTSEKAHGNRHRSR